MQVVGGYQLFPNINQGTVVTIGNFDGVHLGHQALIKKTVAHAQAHGFLSVVYTFDPHPVRLLRPSLAPEPITSLAQKLKLIESLGVDYCIVEPFNYAFANQSADDFVKQVLVQTLGVKHVIVGHDFNYGQKGTGNFETLQNQAIIYGFSAEHIEVQAFSHMVASSTKIRSFIRAGQVDGAALLLGRYYSLEGLVVHGEGRGHALGFATANIETDSELIPKFSVYATTTQFLDLPNTKTHRSITNIGVKPTLSRVDFKPTIETHIFNFNQDIYGARVRVFFIDRIREEKRFSSLEDLKIQIAHDIDQAHRIHQKQCTQ